MEVTVKSKLIFLISNNYKILNDKKEKMQEIFLLTQLTAYTNSIASKIMKKIITNQYD